MIVMKSVILTIPAVIVGGWFYGPMGIFAAMALVNLLAGSYFHWTSWRQCLRQEHTLQPAT
jgi:predicted PurR-regulated permease PerM